MSTNPTPTYKVLVNDNTHYMDEDQQRVVGEFANCQDAVVVCQQVVDRFLRKHYRTGMPAEQLLRSYKGWGEDAWILTTDKDCKFSAWTYAERRCMEICGGKS